MKKNVFNNECNRESKCKGLLIEVIMNEEKTQQVDNKEITLWHFN